MTDGTVEEIETIERAPEIKVRGKGKSVAVLVVVLIVVIGLIFALVFLTDLLKPKPSGGEQPTPSGEGLIEVGTPQATAVISKERVEDAAMVEVQKGETGYVYCRQLEPGDRVATMGDDPKYVASGPVWFIYVDEEPGAWFEHDVKYIFIDAATGEKTVYQESWPPDINGEDMLEAADECGGATTIIES